RELGDSVEVDGARLRGEHGEARVGLVVAHRWALVSDGLGSTAACDRDACGRGHRPRPDPPRHGAAHDVRLRPIVNEAAISVRAALHYAVRQKHVLGPPGRDAPAAMLSVHHLAVLVYDLGRAEAFYGTVLGLPVQRRWADGQGASRSVWLGLGGEA